MEATIRFVVSEELVDWEDIEAEGHQWSIPYPLWPTSALEAYVRYVYGLDAYLSDGVDHREWHRVECMEWEFRKRTIRTAANEKLQGDLSYLSQHGYPTWDRDPDNMVHEELAYRGLLCLYDCVPF